MPRLKVVSNTTPILSLIKIGKLELLKDLFGSISVPPAVYREIEAGKDKTFYSDLKTFDWINIKSIQSANARALLFDLDDGEAEAIILAQEQQSDLVIIDEKNGRRYAAQMGLTITGTVGVLLDAKEKGLISEVAPLLTELQSKQSWLNDSFVKKILQMAGEERR